MDTSHERLLLSSFSFPDAGKPGSGKDNWGRRVFDRVAL
jgi:hypothetical protein